MTNLKFKIFYDEKENEVKRKKAHIIWKNTPYDTIVQTDIYGEYIIVPNYLGSSDIFPDGAIFSGRLKDAIESIKLGDGDAINYSSIANNLIIGVRYYLNREIGEYFRNKTINGWKDTKFEFVIFKYDNFEGCYLSEDNHLVPISFFNKSDSKFGIKEKIRYFASKEEANAVIDEIYSKSKKMIKEYEKDESYFFNLDIDQLNDVSFEIIHHESDKLDEFKFIDCLSVIQISN